MLVKSLPISQHIIKTSHTTNTIPPNHAFSYFWHRIMILVTGASGFLGKHVVRTLSAQGKLVRALYYSNPPMAADLALPGIEWQKADLLDVYDVETAMQGITHIYHCAAIISFQPADQQRMLHFNPESTANLINQALEQDITKLVYVSSIAALGRSGALQKEITEEEEWGENGYNSAYGISKYMAETEVWRGIGEGLNAVIVNPGIILGEGDFNEGSAELMKVVFKEFPYYTRGTTAWADVKDVATILCSLMDSGYEAERYIVSAGNYSYQEIFTHMARALGKKPPHIYANSFITSLVWRWGRLQSIFGKKPVVTRETASTAHSMSFYSNQKLLGALPSFAYTPIAETIERMAKAFLNNTNIK